LVREIWFLDDARVFGGGQGNVWRLASFVESLPDRSARVFCPGKSQLASRCRAAGIPVTNAAFPDLSPLAARRIARAVRDLRRVLRTADTGTLIVGASLRTQVYAHAAALGLRRAPPIVHYLPEQDSARRLTTRLMLRRFDALVVVGQNSARAYEDRLTGARVQVANTFLLPHEFGNAASRAKRQSRNERPTLGVLARLIPEKGVLELVDELSQVREAWSRALIAGTRENERYARAVEDRLEVLGLAQRVRLLGHVDDLGAFFDDAEVLVVPSVGNEGQPTVVIEALAYGRSAIVREPIWSDDFKGLPVLPYRSARDLERALANLDESTVDLTRLAEHFGPMQFLKAVERAATAAAEE
jgi:glycosyltransferase involved in cell wall biosynthesis